MLNKSRLVIIGDIEWGVTTKLTSCSWSHTGHYGVPRADLTEQQRIFTSHVLLTHNLPYATMDVSSQTLGKLMYEHGVWLSLNKGTNVTPVNVQHTCATHPYNMFDYVVCSERILSFVILDIAPLGSPHMGLQVATQVAW